MQTLFVKAISVEELTDLNTFTVALYDDAELPNEWIEFQKTLLPDEQDRLSGMDTYCIVLSNGATFYGGIESCVLQGDVLKVMLSVSAAEALETAGELELHLQVPQGEIFILQAGLNRLFEDDRERPETLKL